MLVQVIYACSGDVCLCICMYVYLSEQKCIFVAKSYLCLCVLHVFMYASSVFKYYVGGVWQGVCMMVCVLS